MIRSRWVKSELKALKVDSATGPDLVPARILKACALALYAPLASLIRKMIANSSWPDAWRKHWLFPIFKKGATTNVGNYRGIHLTSILSKVCERVLLRSLRPFFEQVDAFGVSQFAFRKGRSCQDLLLKLTCTWLLAFQEKRKVGLYLSDISGAFDKVSVTVLLRYLRRSGISETLLNFFVDYLAPRSANVVVNGSQSDDLQLSDMVLQGTVLGPSLWNIFFKDVQRVADQCEAKEAKFADDLTMFKLFDTSVPSNEILSEMHMCQLQTHRWGSQHQVSFDAGKEEFAVLHHVYGDGPSFRLLGPVFDVKLCMHDAVDKLVRKARPKIHAILKSRRYYSEKNMVIQFKTHVLSLLESSGPYTTQPIPSWSL